MLKHTTPHVRTYNWWVVTGTMDFYDFPFSWEWKIIPTDELHHFSRWLLHHQPIGVEDRISIEYP